MPKADQAEAFEAALKAHMAKRVEMGDARSWQVYQAVTGDEMNNYVIRSCCHSWADKDSYQAWVAESDGRP